MDVVHRVKILKQLVLRSAVVFQGHSKSLAVSVRKSDFTRQTVWDTRARIWL